MFFFMEGVGGDGGTYNRFVISDLVIIIPLFIYECFQIFILYIFDNSSYIQSLSYLYIYDYPHSKSCLLREIGTANKMFSLALYEEENVRPLST